MIVLIMILTLVSVVIVILLQKLNYEDYLNDNKGQSNDNDLARHGRT